MGELGKYSVHCLLLNIKISGEKNIVDEKIFIIIQEKENVIFVLGKATFLRLRNL